MNQVDIYIHMFLSEIKDSEKEKITVLIVSASEEREESTVSYLSSLLLKSRCARASVPSLYRHIFLYGPKQPDIDKDSYIKIKYKKNFRALTQMVAVHEPFLPFGLLAIH
jgi:hypothetical protein